MTHTQKNYADLIRQRGYRLTPQRKIILDAICAGGQHTTPEEIYSRAREKAPDINQATVYRTLDFLCELGLVVSADIGIGQKVYEIAGATPHHHLVCERCQQVQELEDTLVVNLFTEIERQREFEIKTNHLVLFGLCKTCAKGK